MRCVLLLFMDDKTLMPQQGAKLSRTFLYREDWLLFGLLVRHGLVEPTTWEQLALAQRRHLGQPTLFALLAETAGLSEIDQRNIQELLDILSRTDLRAKLPSTLPEVDTLLERTSIDAHPPAPLGAEAPTVRVEPLATPASQPARPISPNDPTIADSLPQHTGSSSTVLNSSFASMGTLTDAELRRIERARESAPLVGRTIAGHVLLDRLGSGGQGDVYLAKQLSLNRYVALKKLEVPGHASAESFLEAFRQEAQILGSINHGRIVKVYEIFQVVEGAFFTMEHISGKTVKDLVKESAGGLPVDVAANLACQSLSALGRTSEDGLIHRDIKPANMLVDENGDLKIVDFGLAAAQATLDENAGFAGTPHFASPEQCAGQPLTPASDQYSLGVTLFYALTGKLPFESRKLTDLLDMQINVAPPLATTFNEQLPSSVDRVLQRMMAKKPADRFATFQDCFDAWEKILADASKRAIVGKEQFLGDSLRRLGREDKDRLVRQSAVLGGLWLAMALGSIAGEISLRSSGLHWVVNGLGVWGTWLLVFSLSCIFYVAMARRGWLPVWGSLRVWLYTHIATAIPAVIMLLIHSGNFLRGITPGPPAAKPWLTILLATVLIITAVSGSVGLLIFRELRRIIQVRQLALRGGNTDPREAMALALGAQLLSGWRLVHYPLAVFFILMSILHILVSVRFNP